MRVNVCVNVCAVCMVHLPHVNKVELSALLYYISGTAQLIGSPSSVLLAVSNAEIFPIQKHGVSAQGFNVLPLLCLKKVDRIPHHATLNHV